MKSNATSEVILYIYSISIKIACTQFLFALSSSNHAFILYFSIYFLNLILVSSI